MAIRMVRAHVGGRRRSAPRRLSTRAESPLWRWAKIRRADLTEWPSELRDELEAPCMGEVGFQVSSHLMPQRSSKVLNGGNTGISVGALVAVAVALYIVLVVRRRK